MRQDTLVFLLRPERQEILLAMKKRGFGAGKYNGVGGKVQPGESITAAAVREANEEIGVTIAEHKLAKVGEIKFHFLEHPDWAIHCHNFFAYEWEGEPQESEEMAPKWHSFTEIPYEKMWVDDKHWLPRVLAGEVIDAEFHFAGDGGEIAHQRIDTLRSL